MTAIARSRRNEQHDDAQDEQRGTAEPAVAPMSAQLQYPFDAEEVPLDRLKPHPRNYQTHPDDEIQHIMQSLREHGFYKNVVVARDWTILAGHGVVKAAHRLGLATVPVVRKDYDPYEPRALKILAGDNELRHLAEVDDRALTELLREVAEADTLLGTGYDDLMLANLVFVTRPASEIGDRDAAQHWVGMPDYDLGVPGARGMPPATGGTPGTPGPLVPHEALSIAVHFPSDDDLEEFSRRLDLDAQVVRVRAFLWWPARRQDDVSSVYFTDRAPGDEAGDDDG